MHKRVLEIWWSSLPISEKERIARKGSGSEEMSHYPSCTLWWNSLEESRQLMIYTHCVQKHGDETPEWKEGNPYGD